MNWADEIARAEQQLQTTTDGFEEWLAAERERELSRGDGFTFVEAELLDASSPNRPGSLSFESDGTVRIDGPTGGINGLSHSIRLPINELSSGQGISGIRIEFVPKAIPKKADSAAATNGESTPGESTPCEIQALTPFEGGTPKVTTVLVSATTQPADQVDYHRQLMIGEVTASSAADQHGADSILDERNHQWWQPAVGNSVQHLTLTFDRPVDPAETPYLSLLISYGQNRSLPFEWRVRLFSGSDTDSKWDDCVSAAIVEDQKQWDADTRQQVLAAFRRTAPGLSFLRTHLANLKERRDVLTGKHSTMVMNTAATPRETFMLTRGQYDSPTERVYPQTPAMLPSLQLEPQVSATDTGQQNVSGNDQATRLDLARWLTASQSSADRSRRREPTVGSVFWHRYRCDLRRLWFTRRISKSPGTVGLPRGAVCLGRLGPTRN